MAFAVVVHWCDTYLPADAMSPKAAATAAPGVHRVLRFKHHRTRFTPPSGAMGYGVPAGVAAGLLHPDGVVTSCSGNGCA
ncbi:MAG: hypothetical protein P1P84_12085 [Deferrisomatales bacterium]|nr:hypothetical protein [Deferrisomatales bacterium]